MIHTIEKHMPWLMSPAKFDSIFNEFEDLWNEEKWVTKASLPYDVYKETDEEGTPTKLVVQIPSIKHKKEDISIHVDNKIKEIIVDLKKNQEDDKQYIYQGISFGKKTLSFKYGDNVDVSGITSKNEDGMLIIDIPILTEDPAITKIEIK